MTLLRVALVQFSPKVKANIAKAKELCLKLKPRSVDLVCLPEMIFSGYVFHDAASIAPFLEPPRTGPTSLFCAELAKRLKCYVTAGYPEKLQPHEVLKSRASDESEEIELIGANSACMYGPDGQSVGTYRKTNLFETDKTWAIPGSGFATFELPSPLHTVSLGICMDLNAQPPANWTIEEGPYEIADYALVKKAKILILLDAWLDSGAEPDDAEDWRNLNFWAARLRPLWVNSKSPDGTSSDSDDLESAMPEEGDEMIVLVCNRGGEENGKTFAGTSAVFSMKRGSGRPSLLRHLGRTEEGILLWSMNS